MRLKSEIHDEPHRDPLRIEVCRERVQLSALEREWRAFEMGAAFSVAQTYAYVSAALSCQPELAPAVIVARRGDRLQGIWPLAISTSAGGLRQVRPIGCGAREEYSPPMLGDDPQARIAVLRAARALGDILEIYNLPAGPFRDLVLRDAGFKYAMQMSSPVVSLQGVENYRSWLESRSRSFRQGLRQDRRRLGQQGIVEFYEVTAESAQQSVDDLFEIKGEWLRARAIRSSWLFDPAPRSMFTALVGHPNTGVRMFSLNLDRKMVASCLCFQSAGRLEAFVITFDQTFGRFSPGNLLIEDIVGWCIGRGLDFDFRLTSDAYKLRWADRAEPFWTVHMATTWRGVPLVTKILVRETLVKVRSRLGRWIRRARARLTRA